MEMNEPFNELLNAKDPVSKDVFVFKKITDSMVSTYTKKNLCYGDSFNKTMQEYGLVAPCIRLTDKLNRFKTLVDRNIDGIDNESIKDTLLDMANYCVMTLCNLEK